jgi:iron complex transport system substrate-binding protein
MKKKVALSAVLLCLLCSCSYRQQVPADNIGDTLKLKYAENITIVRNDSCTMVVLKNPWKAGEVLHTYWLVQRGSSLPQQLEGTGADVVSVPLQKAVVFNTAHAWLTITLGALTQVRGVADLRFMQLPAVRQRVQSGLTADCGDAMSPNIEQIIDIGADAILLSPFENSGGYGRLEKLGIPLIECADYMETSALGRAEWMKFYGILFGKEREADSLFHVVDSSYQVLKARAAQCGTEGAKAPRLITEKLTGSTWYVPGGRSSVGRLIADANGSYPWADDKHSGSLALPFETVFDKAGDADVWLFNDFSDQPMTYQRLAAEYRGYPLMKAFRKRRVWYVNSLKVPYFEEVSFRPDWLLLDYIRMLHPELGLGEPKYYKKL